MSNDILGSYWTTAGETEPLPGGRQWSPFSWSERCAQAARVGVRGLGLWHEDLRHLLEVHPVAELGQVFVDAGLEYLELEFLMDWYLPEDDSWRQESEVTTRLLFEAAAVLAVHHVKVGNLRGVPVRREQLVDAFGRLCARAAEEHAAPLVYELVYSDVTVGSIEDASALLTGAGATNGGLALDTWHLGKLGIEPASLEAVPPGFPLYVELSDGMRENMEDLRVETTSHRLLPGEGEFDLVGYVRALQGIGYRGPWGVEVLSAELRAQPIDTIFDRTARTALDVLEAGAGAGSPVTT